MNVHQKAVAAGQVYREIERHAPEYARGSYGQEIGLDERTIEISRRACRDVHSHFFLDQAEQAHIRDCHCCARLCANPVSCRALRVDCGAVAPVESKQTLSFHSLAPVAVEYLYEARVSTQLGAILVQEVVSAVHLLVSCSVDGRVRQAASARQAWVHPWSRPSSRHQSRHLQRLRQQCLWAWSRR